MEKQGGDLKERRGIIFNFPISSKNAPIVILLEMGDADEVFWFLYFQCSHKIHSITNLSFLLQKQPPTVFLPFHSNVPALTSSLIILKKPLVSFSIICSDPSNTEQAKIHGTFIHNRLVTGHYAKTKPNHTSLYKLQSYLHHCYILSSSC